MKFLAILSAIVLNTVYSYFVVYEMKDRHEVYTWGDNSNFTLGHTSEHRRAGPEVVDEFRKLGVNLKQVCNKRKALVFLYLFSTM